MPGVQRDAKIGRAGLFSDPQRPLDVGYAGARQEFQRHRRAESRGALAERGERIHELRHRGARIALVVRHIETVHTESLGGSEVPRHSEAVDAREGTTRQHAHRAVEHHAADAVAIKQRAEFGARGAGAFGEGWQHHAREARLARDGDERVGVHGAEAAVAEPQRQRRSGYLSVGLHGHPPR